MIDKLISYFAITVFIISSMVLHSGCSDSIPAKTIMIQPLGNIPPELVDCVYKKFSVLGPEVILRNKITLPSMAFNSSRNRFRADSLIRYLNTLGQKDCIVVGLTDVDISTTKNNIQDWGVIGLGFCPGNACIASSFRLSKSNTKDQFTKVALHELGHTFGLPHCAIKTCFMRDAEGKNTTNEESEFCKNCTSFLRKKGLNLK